MTTFKVKYDRILKTVNDEDMVVGLDNLLGLSYLDGMVDVVTQTPVLREDLHVHIQTIIQGILDFEYGPEHEEFEVAYS